MAGGGSCSGSYIGGGLVLTAGHCVSNGRGQYRVK
jgi:V8-like Glu-specific endopeptidase